MANFAIKQAIDFTLKKKGESDAFLEVDFLNKSDLQIEGDTSYAKKHGSNAIAFPGAKSGTFTVEAEVANWQWLALQFGGELSGGKKDTLTVKGVSESQSFELSGTFKVSFDDGTPAQIMTIDMGNVSPQTNAEITFSDDEVTAFKITFDVMMDTTGNLLVMKPYVASEGLSVKSSK